MISFPSSARVHRILPKEAFYKHLNLSGEIKGKFISDIQRVTLEYSLTAQTLNLELCEAVDEILLLIVELKKRDADPRLFEVIARQNPHRMIFLLRHSGQVRLAIYYSKLYQTQWQPEETLTLQARGINLAVVWEGFIEQIALQIKPTQTLGNIDMRLRRQETQQSLKKKIERIERQTRAEKQPKRKFELYQQLLELKKELEDIT
ncbi:DUF4391 domain-containing protein [Paenibacillus polymyxa]|uniref:DUF4391 domain-containing protein n=1 Tax=Paenibacillus polymyxa TaxID=1406 RepID=UPI0015D592BF|nr:DUF4391 domain-containing protein [Paenibacillus polymyxa]